MKQKDLHLVLTKYWFFQVVSDLKTTEYRADNPFWNKRIWDKKDSFTHVVFHLGYSNNIVIRKITKIDKGTCPYDGWNGNYIRIHFEEEDEL